MPRIVRLPLLLGLLLLSSFLSRDLTAQPAAGTCKSNADCSEKELCAKLFDSCDQTGRCEPRPEDCTERGKLHVRVVCGCDGKTYDNFCLAAMAGTNVKSEGKCAEPEPSPSH
jgi:hypothetical protein